MGRSRRVDVTAALKHPAPSTGLLYWHTIRACHILLPPLQRWAKEQMRHNLQFPIFAYICVSAVIPFDHSHLWSASLLGQVAKALPYWHFVSDPTGSSPGASGILHYTSVCICFIPKPLFILEPPPDFIHFCIQRHNLLIQFFLCCWMCFFSPVGLKEQIVLCFLVHKNHNWLNAFILILIGRMIIVPV